MMGQFTGVLGLWSWPIVNIILAFVESRKPAATATLAMSAPPSRPATARNVETWEWVDWAGRTRTITAHRTVEEE